jgi:hypothetical protein
MDRSKLSVEDAVVLAAGVVLVIGLFAFPWYSLGGPLAAALGGNIERSATSSPYSVWGILAMLLTIAIVVDLILARFVPEIELSTFPRETARAVAGALVLVLLAVKFFASVGNFGWGFYVDVILAIIVAAGAWLNAKRRSTRPIRAPR